MDLLSRHNDLGRRTGQAFPRIVGGTNLDVHRCAGFETTDRHLSDILMPAVDEVEPEEDEHLSWTKKQLARLSMEALAE